MQLSTSFCIVQKTEERDFSKRHLKDRLPGVGSGEGGQAHKNSLDMLKSNLSAQCYLSQDVPLRVYFGATRHPTY